MNPKTHYNPLPFTMNNKKMGEKKIKLKQKYEKNFHVFYAFEIHEKFVITSFWNNSISKKIEIAKKVHILLCMCFAGDRIFDGVYWHLGGVGCLGMFVIKHVIH